jgi:hypothetical protein
MAPRVWPFGGIGAGVPVGDDQAMPAPFGRVFRRVRVQSLVLAALAIAVSGGAVPAAEPARNTLPRTNPLVTRADGTASWIGIAGPLMLEHPTEVPTTGNVVAGPVLRPGLALGEASRVVDTRPPSAALDTLSVEFGELTLRWSDTDGSGSGLDRRIVRVEEAPATPTGCGPFSVAGGVPLEAGESDGGVLSLGTPPSSGCLRVSLELTDRVGHRSTTVSQPYRIQPPAAIAKAKATPPAWDGRYNLFRANAFVTQKTFKWCVAASVQMMVNIVRHRTDRSRGTQARMIAYAQRWDDGPYGQEGGTDVSGWIAALRHYGAGRYRAVGATTAARALRIAATSMRQTGRPAGILVMEGRHAWVLHGFESRTDPRKNRRANITAVRVSGPLYPVQQANGYDPRPNTRMSARALERYFQPAIVGAMVGKYVVVIPTH